MAGWVRPDRSRSEVGTRPAGIVVAQEDWAGFAAGPVRQPPGVPVRLSPIRVESNLDVRVLDSDRRWKRMPYRVGQIRVDLQSLAVRDPCHAIDLDRVVRGLVGLEHVGMIAVS